MLKNKKCRNLKNVEKRKMSKYIEIGVKQTWNIKNYRYVCNVSTSPSLTPARPEQVSDKQDNFWGDMLSHNHDQTIVEAHVAGIIIKQHRHDRYTIAIKLSNHAITWKVIKQKTMYKVHEK